MTKDHKTVRNETITNINICMQKGCRFYERPAAQGVCFSSDPFVAGMSWDYIGKLEKAAEDYVKEVRGMFKQHEKKLHTQYLESCVISDWIDSIVRLDEVIKLRRDNALLKLKVEQLTNASGAKTRKK